MIKCSEKKWPEDVLRQISETLFHPATGLIYDYVTSRDPEKRFAHLPSPEEVAHSFPNACGWGTGMEDCALNTGLMLCLMSLLEKEDSAFARSLAEGLIRCGRVHGELGFIVRGILPTDGHSCYINTSRDQVTVADYGMWRFMQGGRVPADLQREGIDFLCAAADYCEKTICAETHYDYRRLDGGPAVVSKMWECDPHEAMRLPMIYGIAAHVSGEPRYFDLMRRFAEEGLRQTLTLDPNSPTWWDMPLLQMQQSLKFFEESAIMPELLPGILHGMRLAAEIAERLLAILLDDAESYSGSWTELYDNWRLLPMNLRNDTLSENGHSALYGGLTYMNPVFRQKYSCPTNMLRGIGNYLAVMAHCPNYPVPAEFVDRTDRLLAGINSGRISGVGMVPLIYGYCNVQNFNFSKILGNRHI